jgi:hypothetical protein
MGFYDDITAEVLDILNECGGPATFISRSTGTYDPATGTSPVVDTPYTVQMVAFDFLQKRDGDSGQGNTLLKSGDKEIYMASKILLPRPNPKTDSIVYTGRKYSIITVKELNPSGIASVVYQLFIRE